MSFAHPLALLLLLLLVPVGLLYWLRLRVPRVVVGTGMFWQMALAEEPLRARWQRWRTPVSLMLHVLTVVLLALAAAGPQIPPPQRIVLILDNSATMRATDVPPTRIDAAKTAARQMIDNLRWGDTMAIVTTSPNPLEVQSLTDKKELLRAAVKSVNALPEPPAIGWAVKVAHEIGGSTKDRLKAGPRAPGIVLITDACEKDATRRAEQAGVEVLRVGSNAGNCAITCFTARRSKTNPAQCEAFVEVQNHSDQSAQGKLELYIGGKPGPSVAFQIEKDGRWQYLFDKLTLPSSAHLTARIMLIDDYPFDNVAELFLHPTVPNKAADYVASPSLPHSRNEHWPADADGGLAALYRGKLIEDLHSVASGTPPIAYAEYCGPVYGEPSGIDIRVPGDIGKDALTVTSEPARPPPWIPLAAAAAVLAVLEWCLYLRRWTS